MEELQARVKLGDNGWFFLWHTFTVVGEDNYNGPHFSLTTGITALIHLATMVKWVGAMVYLTHGAVDVQEVGKVQILAAI
jgi:hypothetical protein